MVQLNFDANQVTPNMGWEPVPEGWYKVAITESDMKSTRDNMGAYLQLAMNIIEGEHAGRSIITRLNLQNQNQKAVDIAYGELSAICHAIKVHKVEDSSQLHNIPFEIRVIVQRDEDDRCNVYMNNVIKGYKSISNDQSAFSQQQTSQKETDWDQAKSPPWAGATQASPPWAGATQASRSRVKPDDDTPF